ncbi:MULTISPECIES: PaRep2b protein [Pyrobaculum]|nr:PaRep2b protein [Pyrobaculum arsenaticum]MCY0890434.1 PaRep2b protein [Pyrobaculum arsenaticum]NYR14616.1 PaRep2b protein [Pyrobaculum arsenaticum]
MVAKYGIAAEKVNVVEDKMRIFFSREYAAEAFAEAWDELSWLWRFDRKQELYADHLFKKLQHVREYVEKHMRIEHVIRGAKATVYFKDVAGNEIAHINISWDGKSLHAAFGGARKKAERLVAILNALGADVEAREHGGTWYVQLYTGSITAIRCPELLEAVSALAGELYKSKKIAKEQRGRLLREIEAGPNVVEVAGVELNVNLKEEEIKSGASKRLMIIYEPTSPEAFDAAVKALKEAGFVEGVHFTAKKPEKEERGFISLKVPSGLWKLEELRRQGVKLAERAVSRLEEMAKARGFYDLVEEHLRPAKEVETIDPREMVAEDPERGVKAVIRDVKVEWENGRPRVEVEYEVNGDVKSLSFIWGVDKGGAVRAGVGLNNEKAAVFSTITCDEKLKGKKGVATLTAKHIFALAKYKGVGWQLLRWYAEVMNM